MNLRLEYRIIPKKDSTTKKTNSPRMIARSLRVIPKKESTTKNTNPPRIITRSLRVIPKKESTTKKTNPPRMIARSLSTSVLTSNVRLKTRGAKPAALQQSSANEMDVASVYPDGSFCCFIANDLPIAGSSFGALTGAVKDALRLKKHLVDRRQFKCVGELFNENATAQNVRQLFSSVKSLLKSKPRSRFVLFLACHTLHVPEEQEAWLGLFGFDPSNLEATSLEVRCLKTFAKRLDSLHQLYLIDSCHSGTLLHRVRGSFEKSMASSPAILGMAASSSNQQAAENQTGGMFTSHLLKALKLHVEVELKLADGGEKEKKWMTTHEIFAKVARGVSSECFEKFGHKQTPAFGVLFSETKLGVKCEGSVLFRASF